jgi:hypothetical protein
VIDMNEAEVRTIEQMREVLSGTQALQFPALPDDAQRYRWIEGVLRRIRYRTLPRASSGIVLAYLQRFSGYRRAQVTWRVSRWVGHQALVKRYRPPTHAFARRYTAADVAPAGRGRPHAGDLVRTCNRVRIAPPARCVRQNRR